MRSENSSFNWTHFEHKRKRKYYRLSVDHMKDFLLIKSIIENFSNQRTNYSIDEIIEFCDPRIQSIKNTLEEMFDVKIKNHSLYFFGEKNKK